MAEFGGAPPPAESNSASKTSAKPAKSRLNDKRVCFSRLSFRCFRHRIRFGGNAKLRRRQQQLREKEWERRLRLQKQARQRASELVPDPANLWAIWERDPHTAALYDEGYRLWRLQRYGEMADKVEKGLNRCPTYVRGYAMLLQASARVNQWERGLKRLTDVPPEVWTDLFDALSEDNWLIQRLRERRPAEWQMRFTNFYPTRKSWGAQLPSAEEAAHLEDAVLAARGGTLWVNMDQDGRRDGEHYVAPIWRFRNRQWRMYWAPPPWDIFMTSDGRAWTVSDWHTNRFPLQVFEGGRFVPLFLWSNWGSYSEVVEWQGEVWIGGEDGLFRRTKGKWLLYQWGGDVVRVPPRKLPDGSRRWTRVMRDSGLPKLDDTSSEEGVLCTDSQGRLWWGKRLFDGTRFVLPDAQPRSWWKRRWVDSAYRLWNSEEGFWGKSKWMLNWKGSSEYHYWTVR